MDLPVEDKNRRKAHPGSASPSGTIDTFIRNLVVDINSDIDIDIGRENMFPLRHWMKHTALVPKGFLRYQVLKLLNKKPMSGSEIMSQIEKQTNGHWRPSPGSIYPLLAWLQDKGYIKEVAEKEAGTKRYTLTEQGKAFLEEHHKTREEVRRRSRHFGPGPAFMGPMWFEFYPERATELRRATKDLAIAVWDLRDRLRDKYSKKAAEQASKALEEAARKISEIAKKMR